MAIFLQPAVSGLFYPKEKKELKGQILSFLKKAKKEDWGKPKILIVPHLGIVYSGQTVAFGFNQVEGQDFKKVILLGVSHTSWFSYAAVDDLDFWVTSLGQVALDKDFIDFLIDGKYILKYKRSFIKNHCLEMELTFLQKVLTDFKIFPILLSEADSFLIEKLAEKIAQKIDKKTLVVVSSDL